MSAVVDPSSSRLRSPRSVAGLVSAVLAGAALLVSGPSAVKPKAHPIRTTAERAWPGAHRADVPGNLPDGPFFQPLLFVDAATAVGTAPTADGRALRFLVRGPDGRLRELHRLPNADEPLFDQVTLDGDQLVWTETTASHPPHIWTAFLHGSQAARRFTADMGQATFFGNQYDLVVAGGRVYWTANPNRAGHTEVRSIALTGGRVQVRDVVGEWALSAWPWLTDDGGNQSVTTSMLNLNTGRQITIESTGPELRSCTPVWCRAMVSNATGLDHIDLVHPDGTGRRRIAGGRAREAVTDVAVLNRFEILSEPGPHSDLTGTAGLLVYDISTGNTVDLSPYAEEVVTRNGVLWWSTGDQDHTVWHSVDLRTA